MGNRRLGRKRIESVLKQMNATAPDTTGSRSGLKGFEMPAFELQPSKYFGVFDDFLKVNSSAGVAVNEDAAQATSIDSDLWTINIDGTSDAAALDSTKTGGVMKFTMGSSAGEEVQIQALNAGFAVDASSARKVWFETRIQLDDISGGGFFVGLASNNGGEEVTMIDSLEDGLGFICATGASPNIASIGAKGNTETQTDTGVDIADATWVTLSYYFDGTTAHFYVNGDLKVSSTSNLPNDGTILFPSVEFTAVGTDQDVMYLDYVRCCMER
tara:strand:+ start:406 stop:1218 length:813 start_codon:yes stop_codon:yes gene_type:complete